LLHTARMAWRVGSRTKLIISRQVGIVR
jgi:hypothetical protein